MRLINAETLEFVEFATVQCNSPPYYILSHRWQENEISYRDFKKGRRKDSQGYQKVLDFCRFAQKRHEHNREGWQSLLEEEPESSHQGDRLKIVLEYPCYIWIDTCCIDQSSSAELSLSINSMWEWYGLAVECHIYLSDVHTSEQGPELDEELRASSWFGRCWTLQELLAPAENDSLRLLLNSRWELISQIPSLTYWTRFGSAVTPYLHSDDVESLLSVVSEITGIQEDYLTGTQSIKEASVACRMSWASHKKATLPEDEAYCLMGIFDINMPLLYGEGQKAFRRLQEEIIKTSTDQSIFTTSTSLHLSAHSPFGFRENGTVVTESHDGNRVAKHMPIQPFEITNLGVRFRAVIRRGRRHHGRTEELWTFQLDCFETSGAENTPTSMYLALREAIEEDESTEQPLVLRKEAVIRGEKGLHEYFQSLEEPMMKTFYVKF